MEVSLTKSPFVGGGSIRGYFLFATARAGGTGAASTPLANTKFTLYREAVHHALQAMGAAAINAISPNSARTGEIGQITVNGAVVAGNLKVQIEKATEFVNTLKLLRKATGAGTETSVRINADTGATVNNTEN
jgi:hypothetical protein